MCVILQGFVDPIMQQPHVLKQMCLADFVALTDTVYSNNPIVSDDEMSVNENSSDEENEDITKKVVTHIILINYSQSK